MLEVEMRHVTVMISYVWRVGTTLVDTIYAMLELVWSNYSSLALPAWHCQPGNRLEQTFQPGALNQHQPGNARLAIVWNGSYSSEVLQ